MAREGTARDRRLDTVRSLAIIMVLVIHSAAAGLAGRAPGTADWWGALLWGAAARPAVPLFFLCSGALMLCRDISPKRLLTHNLPRIVCAMLVWAFLYRLVRLAGEGITPAGLWDGVKRTLLLQHESHFYYLHILLLVYAFVPVVRVFVRNASRRDLEYLLAVWFVTGILFPLLRHFWPFRLVTQINTWYRMNMAYSAIGFAALGHYVRQYGGTIPLGWYRISLAAGLGITFGGGAARGEAGPGVLLHLPVPHPVPAVVPPAGAERRGVSLRAGGIRHGRAAGGVRLAGVGGAAPRSRCQILSDLRSCTNRLSTQLCGPNCRWLR